MKQIGFCHGVLHKVIDVYTKENIRLFTDCGCSAIEVHYHSAKEANFFNNILEEVKKFSYTSIHTPTDARYGNNEATRSLLKIVEDLYFKIKARLAVVHPDSVDDWSVFDDFKINWAIENMDDRKRNYKSVSDLKKFLASMIAGN